MTTTPATLTCEADVADRFSTRAHACGLPATKAFKTTTYDGKERIEARCARHAGVIKRTRWPGGTLVDLTPEAVEAITTRLVETRARRDAERAAKMARGAELQEAARVEAHAADAVAWTAVRADEHALDSWVGAAPVYRDVPRWVVRPVGVERPWDDIEVKATTRDGWPASIELRAGQRLTRRQALALADALIAAATGDDPCDGFRGGNAWGACADCGRPLDQHA